jgi:hypothetical protein
MLKKGNLDEGPLPGLSTGSGSTRKANSLIDEMEDELDEARHLGVIGILKFKYEAWVEERLHSAVQRKMAAKKQLLMGRGEVLQAEQGLAATIHTGVKQEVIQEIETSQMGHVLEESKVAYNQQLTSQLVPQLSHFNPQGAPVLEPEIMEAESVIPRGSVTTPLQIHVADDEIQGVALQALLYLMSGEKTELEMQTFWQGLAQKYPPLVMAEIQNRVQEMSESTLPQAGNPSPHASNSSPQGEKLANPVHSNNSEIVDAVLVEGED